MKRILIWTKAKKLGLLSLASAMAVALLVIAACAGSSPATVATAATATAPQAVVPSEAPPPIGAPAGVVPSGEASVLRQDATLAGVSRIQYSSSQQLGIWVTGRGEVTTAPDLVILNVGVEARGLTVAGAQADAAEAMDSLMGVLAGRGVEDKDIQTRSFNISPEYRYNESRRRQELVGYMVRNQLTVKLRDVGNVGPVIDEVVTAGGDLVRVEGIRFTVEDTTALETQAREEAVGALMAKAQQFADLTGVQLGDPVFLSESSGSVPQIRQLDARVFAEGAPMAAPAVSTRISGGELTVSVSVQGSFSIVE